MGDSLLSASTQTDPAAPTTPSSHKNLHSTSSANEDVDEATKAYRRPQGVVRTSSSNYATALVAANQGSAALNMSTDTKPSNITGSTTTQSPVSTTSETPFPAPSQGVVPLRSGVGTGQAEAVKKVSPTGLSLGSLGRQASWSEQDMKHIFSARLMGRVEGDAGYSSGTEGGTK
ncbi:hypothetical protein K469DRAFT_618226 [Zopfia rhizophila CBS 207.26]|uniref:Uncharacterized protein n=1 Tax=Zopfia rhizophila CBS 207.26 TaxID=1314779 RepID=A0A6A6EU19_9PEZI|nr:hypothetical protein K469DRAFT_618226 [Zopfia rhizophila CBS 207.26]